MIETETKHVRVLSSDSQNYSSTHVSGGGAGISIKGYGAGSSSVKSEVTDHQVEHIWVQDVKTGQDEKLTFKDKGVETRQGHELILVRWKGASAYSRVHNLSTGKTYRPYYLEEYRYNVFQYLMSFILSLIPLVGGLYAGVHSGLRMSLSPDKHFAMGLGLFAVIAQSYFFVTLESGVGFLGLMAMAVMVVWVIRRYKVRYNEVFFSLENSLDQALKNHPVPAE